MLKGGNWKDWGGQVKNCTKWGRGVCLFFSEEGNSIFAKHCGVWLIYFLVSARTGASISSLYISTGKHGKVLASLFLLIRSSKHTHTNSF